LRFSALAFAAAATPAAAQNADIVVTGRGLSQGLGEDVYSVAEIGRDRLSGSASNRLDDILRDVPGFQMFRRSDARSANPTSQGATLRALGGNASSRALLILDGVPQTDPFGGWVSWPAYDPRRLGMVRVVRGGGSGVNGPGALAGTIELVSAVPSDLEGFGASASYGSRDSVDLFAGAGVRAGGGFVTLSGSYARGDGFVPVVAEQRGPVDRPSPYQQASLSIRTVAPISSNVELQANGLLFKDDRERGTALAKSAQKARTHRFVWWAAATGPGRHSATGRPGTSTTASQASTRRAPASHRRRSNMRCLQPALAPGWRCGRRLRAWN
jgi:outer membrane cobalamin receptor